MALSGSLGLKNLIQGRVMWDIDFQNTGSWLWRRLMKLRALARPFMSAKVGNNLTILFWIDDWTDLGSFIELTDLNGPQVSGIPYKAVVAQAVANGMWSLPRGKHPLVVLLKVCLPLLPSLVLDKDDEFFWKVNTTSSPSQFSSSRTWFSCIR